MSPLVEVKLVATRELLKNLRGPKGIVLSALALVGGLVVALLATYQQGPRVTAEQLNQLRDAGKVPAGADFARELMMIRAPSALALFLEVSVWLTPALVWLAGFDAISGEIQHRTVRYWAGRTRRQSFYVGKVVGLLCTVAVITFAMHALVWVVTIIRGGGDAAETIGWGVRFWAATLPITAAWCGLAALLGSLFRAPLAALLATGFAFFALFMVGGVVPMIVVAATADVANSTAKALALFYPNGYDRWLLNPDGSKVVVGLLACLGFLVVPSVAGAVLHSRRDV